MRSGPAPFCPPFALLPAGCACGNARPPRQSGRLAAACHSALQPGASWPASTDASAAAAPEVQVVQPLLSSPLFRAYTFVVRALNNLGGGMTYVMLVKALGVQKAGKEE